MPILTGTSGSGDAAWSTTLTDALTLSGNLTFTGATLFNSSAAIGGATVLTAADSGTLYTVTQVAGNYDIDLPAVATSAGVWFTFVLGTAAAGNVVIDGGAANTMLGALVEGGAAATPVNHRSVAFDGGTAVIGDHLTVRCNGTVWLVSGIGTNANSWILA